MNAKVCTKCKVEKPTTDFRRQKATKDGLQYHCKGCCSARQRTYHAANRIDRQTQLENGVSE